MKLKSKMFFYFLTFSLVLSSIFGTSASAAKKISITKKVTIIDEKKMKIKLKNNKKKVIWKVIKGKNIVKLKKKTKSYAIIRGVKKGSAKVQAKIGKKKYVFTVKVIKASKNTTTVTQEPNPTNAS